MRSGVEDLGAGDFLVRSRGCGAGRGGLPRRREGTLRGADGAGGDIIRPLGLGGTKKVLRAMMDRKVPRDLRRRTPVVVDGRDEVAWIVLGELDERFKVDERTQKVLRLEVARIS